MTSNINLSSLSLKFSKLFSFLNLFLAFSTLVFAKSVADPTYYKLLDVPYDADDSTLKKAYRKLALKHHPDKLPPDSTAEDKKLAEDKFAEISVAYDTLSNPDKRRMYDQVGVDGIKRGGGGGGGDDSGSPFGPGGIDPRKIFEQFFGGSGGGMGGGGMPNIDGASGFSFSSSGSGTSFSFTMHSGGGGGGSGAGGGGDPFADFFGGGGGGSNQRAQVAGPERGYFYEEGDDKDGSGGGGDDGSSDGGGGSGGDAPLITHIQENSDSDSSTFKKMMNEKNSRFIAVLFTEEILKNSYKDTAKSSIRKLAKTYRNVAPVYTADCRKVPKACSVIEPDVQAYPHVAFINGKAQETLLHRAISGPDATDSKKLNKFVADVFPGKDIAILSSMNEKEKFVASSNSGSNGGAASLDITMTIVFLTDKKVSSSNTQAIPPIIRGLSEELSGRVKFGIAGPKIDEVTFRSFSLDSDPKKHSLPCFYDVSSMKFFKKPGNQLRSYLISNYNVQQRLAKKKRESGISEITTLTTPDSSSTCGKKDSQFCLLVLQDGSYFSSSTVTSEDLLKVANSLKNDPVRVFWITPSKGGPIGGLYTEATKVEGFNDKNLPKILIWRPKRSKYEIYNPNPDNDSDSENKPDDSISEASYYTSPKIIDFVRSFLDGGKSLSKRHDDKIWDVEMGKMEL